MHDLQENLVPFFRWDLQVLLKRAAKEREREEPKKKIRVESFDSFEL